MRVPTGCFCSSSSSVLSHPITPSSLLHLPVFGLVSSLFFSSPILSLPSLLHSTLSPRSLLPYVLLLEEFLTWHQFAGCHHNLLMGFIYSADQQDSHTVPTVCGHILLWLFSCPCVNVSFRETVVPDDSTSAEHHP